MTGTIKSAQQYCAIMAAGLVTALANGPAAASPYDLAGLYQTCVADTLARDPQNPYVVKLALDTCGQLNFNQRVSCARISYLIPATGEACLQDDITYWASFMTDVPRDGPLGELLDGHADRMDLCTQQNSAPLGYLGCQSTETWRHAMTLLAAEPLAAYFDSLAKGKP